MKRIALNDFLKVFDVIGLNLIIIDEDFNNIYATQKAEENFGSINDFLMLNWKNYFTDIDLYNSIELVILKQKKIKFIKIKSNLINKIFNIEIVPLKYKKLQLTVIWFDDITDVQLLNEKLFQMEKISSLGEIISGIIHEISNLISGIMLFSELLLSRKDIKSSQKDYINKIYSLAKRTGKIISNLLLFISKDSKKRQFVNINEVLKGIIKLISYEIDLLGIKLNEKYDNNLPNTIVDKQQIEEVFINITNNALNALDNTDKDKVLEIETKTRDNNILINIRNTGDIIKKKYYNKIFEPFFTTKSKGKGTGLGLSIAKDIIEKHNGKISFKSEKDTGTTFTVELPINEEQIDTKVNPEYFTTKARNKRSHEKYKPQSHKDIKLH
jgi:signal transduction histidine kinase